MERPIIIAGNWKMHKTIPEAVSFIEGLAASIGERQAHVFIAPPFTAIASCAQAVSDSPIIIGAQNMSDVDEGAFTGEISARMLRDAGAQFVLLGHSERRHIFHESDEHIHHKLKRALQEEIFPILCIGETKEQREGGHSEKTLIAQLKGALEGCSEKQVSQIAIAYEPVWAIGTGQSATPDLANEAHRWIRDFLESQWGKECAKTVPILYGGSVKPGNISQIISEPDIDGVLIGGASLDLGSFIEMIQAGDSV